MKKLLLFFLLLFASVAEAQIFPSRDWVSLNLNFAAANAKIIPGSTSLLVRNNADSITNVSILDSGLITVLNALGTTAIFGDSAALDLSTMGDGQYIARKNGNAKVRLQAFGTSTTGYFACDRARGTAAAPTALGADEPMCSFVSTGYDGNVGVTVAHGFEIQTLTTEAWTASAHGSQAKFLTILDGSTTQTTSFWLNYAGEGAHYLFGGAAATGHINFQLGHASALFKWNNASGNTMWSMDNSGDWIQNAADGSNIQFNKAGSYIYGNSVNIKIGTLGSAALQFTSNNVVRLSFAGAGSMQIFGTVTAGGTTGNQTINKISGRVNFAGAATALTVTNSLIAATSMCVATANTNDASGVVRSIVPGAGSLVINLVAPGLETAVTFMCWDEP